MEGASVFSGGGGAVVFQMGGGFIFKWGCTPRGGIGFDGGFSKKIVGWGAPPHLPTMGNTVYIVLTNLLNVM